MSNRTRLALTHAIALALGGAVGCLAMIARNTTSAKTLPTAGVLASATSTSDSGASDGAGLIADANSQSTKRPVATQPLYEPSSVARSPDWSIRVEKVQECPSDRHAPPEGEYNLGVAIVIEGISNRGGERWGSQIIDSDGNTYNSTTVGCEPHLPDVPVAKGEQARGWEVFVLPRTARGLTFRLSGRRDNSAHEFNFDLKR